MTVIVSAWVVVLSVMTLLWTFWVVFFPVALLVDAVVMTVPTTEDVV